MASRDYKAIWQRLLKEARSKGLHVHVVKPKRTRDFVGMNSQAAKAFGIKGFPANTIHIDSDLNYQVKCATLKHEIVEFFLMKKGMKYWPAHKIALREEKRL